MNSVRAFVVAGLVALPSCGKIERTCFLPVLRTNEVTRVLKRVPDACPVPVARTVAVTRPYGAVYLEWSVSTRGLLMRASSHDNKTKYVIAGEGVQPFSKPPPSTEHREYTSVQMSPRNDFDETHPKEEPFSITVPTQPGSADSFIT